MLGGVGAQQQAAQAGMLVDAGGVVGTAAVAECDLAICGEDTLSKY